MSERCPHLGLLGNQSQVFSVASQRHRCYALGNPERIAGKHQAETCLAAAFRRCPRLEVEPASDQPATGRLARPAPRVPSSTAKLEGAHLAGRGSRLRLDELYSKRAERPRRPLTVTELVVLVLSLAILLACSFTGYAVIYRLQAGPGMAPPALVAEAATTVPPTVPPTLAPIFTATPSPIPPVTLAATEPLPPTPEIVWPTSTPDARPPADLPPSRLVIPKIGVDILVSPVGVKTVKERNGSKVIWADLPNAGGFHNTSAFPGHPGNTVINGHRDILGSVFRSLDKLATGDEIVLYAGGNAYAYQVTETLVVPEAYATAKRRAENLRLIGYMPEERLTLITCTPVGLATHRLLVIAKPADLFAPQMPEAGQSTSP